MDDNTKDKLRILLGLAQLKQQHSDAFSLVREPYLDGYPFPDPEEALHSSGQASRYWLYTDSEEVIDLMKSRYESSKSPSESKSLTVIEAEREGASPKYKIAFHSELINMFVPNEQGELIANVVGLQTAKLQGITSLPFESLEPEDRMIGKDSILPFHSKANGKSGNFHFALCPVEEREGMRWALIARFDYQDHNKTPVPHSGKVFEQYCKALFPSALPKLREGEVDPQHHALTNGYVDFREGVHPDGMGMLGITYIPDYVKDALQNTYGDKLPMLKDLLEMQDTPDEIERHPHAQSALEALYAEDMDDHIPFADLVDLAKITLAPKNPRERLVEKSKGDTEETKDERVAKHISEYVEAMNKADFYIERRQTLSGEPKEFLVAGNTKFMREEGASLINQLCHSKHCYTGDKDEKSTSKRGAPLSLMRRNQDEDSPNYNKFTPMGSTLRAMLEAGVHVRGAQIKAGHVLTSGEEGEYIPFNMQYTGFKRIPTLVENGARLEPAEKNADNQKPRRCGAVEARNLYMQPYKDENGTEHYAVYAVITAMDTGKRAGELLQYQPPNPNPYQKGEIPVHSIEEQHKGRITQALQALSLLNSDVAIEYLTPPENHPMVARLEVPKSVYDDLVAQHVSPADVPAEVAEHATSRIEILPEIAVGAAGIAQRDKEVIDDLANSIAHDLMPPKNEAKKAEQKAEKEKGKAPPKKQDEKERHTFPYEKDTLIEVLNEFSKRENKPYPIYALGTMIEPPSTVQHLKGITHSELSSYPKEQIKAIVETHRKSGSKGSASNTYDVDIYQTKPQLHGMLWLRSGNNDFYPETKANFTKSEVNGFKENGLSVQGTKIMERAGVYEKPVQVKMGNETLYGYRIPPAIYTDLAEHLANQPKLVTGHELYKEYSAEAEDEASIEIDWDEYREIDGKSTTERKMASFFKKREAELREAKDRMDVDKAHSTLSQLASDGKARIALVSFDRAAMEKQLAETQADVQALEQITSLTNSLSERYETTIKDRAQLVPGQAAADTDHGNKTKLAERNQAAWLKERTTALKNAQYYQDMLDSLPEGKAPTAYIIKNPSEADLKMLSALYSGDKHSVADQLYMPVQRISGAYKEGESSQDAYVLFPKPELAQIFGEKPVSRDATDKSFSEEVEYLRPLRRANTQTQRSKRRGEQSNAPSVDTPIKFPMLTRYTNLAFTRKKHEVTTKGNQAISLESDSKDRARDYLEALHDTRGQMIYSSMRIESAAANKLSLTPGSQPCLVFDVKGEKRTADIIKNAYSALKAKKGLATTVYTLGEEKLMWDLLPHDENDPTQAPIAAMMQLLDDLEAAESTVRLFSNELEVYPSDEAELKSTFHMMGEDYSKWTIMLHSLSFITAQSGLMGDLIANEYGDQESTKSSAELLKKTGLDTLIKKYALTSLAAWDEIKNWPNEKREAFGSDFLKVMTDARQDMNLLRDRLDAGDLGDDISDQDIEAALDNLRTLEDDTIRNKMSASLKENHFSPAEKLRHALEVTQSESVHRHGVDNHENALFSLDKKGKLTPIKLGGDRLPNINTLKQQTGQIVMFCNRDMPKSVRDCLTEQMHAQGNSLWHSYTQKTEETTKETAGEKTKEKTMPHSVQLAIRAAKPQSKTQSFTQKSGMLPEDIYKLCDELVSAYDTMYPAPGNSRQGGRAA